MASQGLPLPLRLCFLCFLLLMLCMFNEKFKSGVSCSETLHSNVSDFEANDHLQMVTKAPKRPPPPPPPSPPPPPPPLPPFTHYLLALQWPPSTCMSKTCDRDLYPPVPERFTIHGLWPNTGQTDCSDEKFEYMKLPKDTRDGLDKAWPSLVRTAGGQQQFLGHEWTKHGTCSGLTQQVYFKTALDLHLSVNVLNRLADCRDPQNKPISYVPGPNKKYYASEIIAAYYKKWGLTIKINCVKKKNSTEEMIGEIHFKVNKDGKTVESITGSTTNCTPGTQASFPAKK